ncbi:ABC transporter substrate-binding protein [Paenibacillus sp. J22TS3]|uniref:ABC transporter substrate-binding protein n=1 Tax=Paenibacillus sp. J22TS3 TaxID=2807192 RepID=UPI001B168E8D|nr:ABC transporter substrate-binding protein [Paenibacillus sp. J22TS3]GIP19979.1 ABC transporter substrate-binding protein [Paenibacillus sp. J22TS3]
MKRKLWLVSICMILAATTACSSSGSTESKEKTKKNGKTVVTLSMTQATEFMQAVEKDFEEKNPDIDLQINSALQVGEKYDYSKYEKFEKTTNTAMLAGKGPDIIQLIGLPTDEYISKQLLVNMSEYLDKDKTLNKNDLQMNVLDALKVNGGLYWMPTGFTLRGFYGDGDVLGRSKVPVDDKNWTWKDFAAVSKELLQAEKSGKNTRYAFAGNPPDYILSMMLNDNYTEFVDEAAKKGKFDSPEFVSLLQVVKQMFDDKVMSSESTEMSSQLFSSEILYDPAAFVNVPYSIFSNPKLLVTPHGQGQKGDMRIITNNDFAIAANSSVKEEAWRFIAFLLSKETQSLQSREGFSLVKSVNEKRLDEVQEQVKNGSFKLPTGKTANVPDSEFAKFKTIINSVDNAKGAEVKVMMIVSDESRSFFSGQKSAEEVAKVIQNRVTTYLNE